MVRVEYHCHTMYSKDSLTRLEDLARVCRARGIDRLVVTDHNTIAGALAMREIDPALVIVGEEIRTTRGELLAAFVKEEVPKGLEPEEVIGRLREQGAFISVSHPFDGQRGWREDDLRRIVPLVDAVEVFNSRCLLGKWDRQAGAFADEMGLLGTVGSDAHMLSEVGRAVMVMEDFGDAEGFGQALENVTYETRRSGPWVRLGSRWAVMRKELVG